MKNKRDSDKKVSKKVDYRMTSFILFTISFFTIFAIRPSVSLIYNLQKEKADYEQVDRVLEDKIQKIITTQAQFMELINNKNLVDQALPSSHQIEQTQQFLNQNLEINAYGIQKITILPKPQQQSGTIVINLAGKGKYQDLLAFLKFINNSRRLITIDYLNLSPDQDATESAQINFTSVLNSFFYSEEI